MTNRNAPHEALEWIESQIKQCENSEFLIKHAVNYPHYKAIKPILEAAIQEKPDMPQGMGEK